MVEETKDVQVVAITLTILLKQKNKEGLLNFIGCLGNTYSQIELCNILLFILEDGYGANFGLVEEDKNYYWEIADDFTKDVTEEQKQQIEFETKCLAIVQYFEENGLRLGVDYSFHDGSILFSPKSFERVKNLDVELLEI